MEQKEPVFEILLIDDNIGTYHTYKEFARKKDVILRYSSNLEDGLFQLTNNNKILAIILDGIGLINKGDLPSNAKEKFATEADKKIEVLESKTGRRWPRCILTAWPKIYEKSFEDSLELFDKNNFDKNKLFDYLITQVKDSKEYRWRTKYSSIFSLLDERYVSDKANHDFYRCCEIMEREDAEGEDLNMIRSTLLEMLLRQMRSYNNNYNLLPGTLFHSTGSPNYQWIINYLNGEELLSKKGNILFNKCNKRVPAYVITLIEYIKNITSTYSHVDYPRNLQLNCFKSAFFAWIALFLWYVDYVDSKKK